MNERTHEPTPEELDAERKEIFQELHRLLDRVEAKLNKERAAKLAEQVPGTQAAKPQSPIAQ